MTALEGFFAQAQTTDGDTKAKRLSGSEQLASIARTRMDACMQKLNDPDVVNDVEDLFSNSKTNNDSMDALIKELTDLSDVDTSFICVDPESDEYETTKRLLASVQSKRSRLKGKDCTLEVYRELMTAAISELIIRQATGKVKSATVGHSTGSVVYTDEQLEALSEDQNEVRRHLRNVQSKKSIAKKKEGFSEESDVWQDLLMAEAQLKGIRTTVVPTGHRPNKVKEQLSGLLDDVDLNKLKKDELIELLNGAKNIVHGEAPTEELTDDAEAQDVAEEA